MTFREATAALINFKDVFSELNLKLQHHVISNDFYCVICKDTKEKEIKSFFNYNNMKMFCHGINFMHDDKFILS